mgnify:FL=1
MPLRILLLLICVFDLLQCCEDGYQLTNVWAVEIHDELGLSELKGIAQKLGFVYHTQVCIF